MTLNALFLQAKYGYILDNKTDANGAEHGNNGQFVSKGGNGGEKKEETKKKRKGSLKVLNKKELHNFINYHKTSKENVRVSLGTISDDAKNRIKKATGLDVDRVILDSDSIRHSFDNSDHNLEPDDLDDMKEVIDTTTDISLSSKKNNNGNPVIIFKKMEPNGVILCEEYRAGKKELELQTAYRMKRNRQPLGVQNKLPANVQNGVAPKSEPATNQTVTIDNITPDGLKINSLQDLFMLAKSRTW